MATSWNVGVIYVMAVYSYTFCLRSSHLSVTWPAGMAGSFWSREETGLQQPEWQVTCAFWPAQWPVGHLRG